MRVLNSLSSAILAISLTTAVATPTEKAPACIIPLVIFESLPNAFSLSAVANSIPTSNVANPFPVRAVPPFPSKKAFSELILSNARIAPTLFKLKNGKLILDGCEAKELPVIEIFPPVLREFVFGGNFPSSSLNFTASFTCDNKGKQFLRLASEEGEFPEDVLPRGSCAGLDVLSNLEMLTNKLL